MAVPHLQTPSQQHRMAPAGNEPDILLTIPEEIRNPPQMRESPPQRLTRLYLETRRLTSIPQREQARITLRSAMNEQTERFRTALETGKSSNQFFKILQLLGETAEFPMLLAAMRAIGNYTSSQAKLLLTAYRDAQFDAATAAVLDNARHREGQVPAGEQLNMLLAAIQRTYFEGNRYADWDAVELMD